MKALNLILGMLIILILFSCKKKDETVNKVDFDEITGVYKGQITPKNSQLYSATADITKADDESVYVHCYGNNLDTTFMLNVYEDGDYTMACYSGKDFENEYGHSSGNGHMMNSSDGSAWQHHMNDEHEVSDNHYGSFDMNHHSFSYTFNMDNSDSFDFYGNRQ